MTLAARPAPGRRRALASVLMPPLALAAPRALAQPAEAPTVLRVAFNVAETGFDPAQVGDLYSRVVTGHIFEALYAYDHLFRPFLIVPNTAAALPEVADEFRVWTVRLKPGIFFADDPAFNGRRRELVAADYVYAFKRFFDPHWKSPAYASLGSTRLVGMNALREAALKGAKFDYDAPVAGLHALDRYTIRFTVEQPFPRLLEILATNDLWGAVAREVVEFYGDDIMAHPVGTGPFRLAQWRRSSKIVLERNPGYRAPVYDAQPAADDADGQAIAARFRGRRLPLVDRVEISIIDENQPRWLAFQNGQVDLMERLPVDFADIAIPNGRLAPNLARRGVQLYRVLAPDVAFSIFNMEDPLVGGYGAEQTALRRAIALATNIDEEIRIFWRGQAVPAQSPVNPGLVGYDPAFRTETHSYDLARAKALLDTYGYVDRDGDGWRERPDGAPLLLVMATQPDQQGRQRDELWRRNMNALGVRIEFRPAKWPENLKNARAGKLMMWTVSTSAAAPDGQPGLDRGASLHMGGQNLARFRSAEFDAIYDRMGRLAHGPERERLFFEAKKILATYMPYRSHVHRIISDLAQPWVHGYRRPPFWYSWWHYVDVDARLQAERGA